MFPNAKMQILCWRNKQLTKYVKLVTLKNEWKEVEIEVIFQKKCVSNDETMTWTSRRVYFGLSFSLGNGRLSG